jgi:hypothetical protein
MPDNSVPRVRLLMAALVKDFDRKIKEPKIVRWVTVLAALVLLYDGIDGIFFDRIVDSGALAWIDRTHAILVGTLLITFSISLFAVAWTGQPINGMSTGSTSVGKLFSYAYCAAVGAFVIGLFLVRTIMHFDSRYLAAMILSGAFLLCVLFWTRRVGRRFATSEIARKHADQFLWSCIFFSMLSFVFGVAVTALILYSADFTRTFGAVWFGALTCVGIYPVLRDAKRLADAVGQDQITSGQTDVASK